MKKSRIILAVIMVSLFAGIMAGVYNAWEPTTGIKCVFLAAGFYGACIAGIWMTLDEYIKDCREIGYYTLNVFVLHILKQTIAA